MSRLDEIPTAFDAPVDARPSAVVARIRAIRPHRRAVLRGLIIGAAAAVLVPIDWYLTRREAAAQEVTGDRSEYMTCQPENYREEANNWPATGPAVCYGGWRRGSFPCEDGYHREGTYDDGETTYESTRVTTSCNGRNAWRWNGYRCSDAITTGTFADGTEYSGLTIAACEVSEAAPVESSPQSSEPAESDSGTSNEPTTRSDTSRSDTSSADSTDGSSGGDPSRPRRTLPSLGTTRESMPVLGALLGGR